MSKSSIIDSLRKISKTDDEVYSVLCTVKSVDTTEKTCVCTSIRDNIDLFDVKLIAENNTGFLILPTVGSKVLVTMINKFTGYVAMFSDIDSIYLNGTNYDGLVKVNDLVTKLNNLENKVNAIISAFNSHVHPGVTTGAGSSAITPTQVAGTLQPTTKNDLENQTVKHGNG